MLSEKAKKAFENIGCDFQPVAVKFCYEVPQGVKHTDKVLPLCGFIGEAQKSDEAFYITVENESCMGKMVMGMIDLPPMECSGTAGVDFGAFCTQAPNARLYHMAPRLFRGSVRYVLFSPVSECGFDPDLIFLMCKADEMELVERANSYFSGDLWETKNSYVMGCSFLFAYPYINGKINSSRTGTHFGQRRYGVFPPDYELITIPYQKIREISDALDEMDRVPIALREDEESKAEMARRIAHWSEISDDVVLS